MGQLPQTRTLEAAGSALAVAFVFRPSCKDSGGSHGGLLCKSVCNASSTYGNVAALTASNKKMSPKNWAFFALALCFDVRRQFEPAFF